MALSKLFIKTENNIKQTYAGCVDFLRPNLWHLKALNDFLSLKTIQFHFSVYFLKSAFVDHGLEFAKRVKVL